MAAGCHSKDPCGPPSGCRNFNRRQQLRHNRDPLASAFTIPREPATTPTLLVRDHSGDKRTQIIGPSRSIRTTLAVFVLAIISSNFGKVDFVFRFLLLFPRRERRVWFGSKRACLVQAYVFRVASDSRPSTRRSWPLGCMRYCDRLRALVQLSKLELQKKPGPNAERRPLPDSR